MHQLHGCISLSTDRETVKKRAVDLICQAYSLMYGALMKTENGYVDPLVLVPRTPEHVARLLS